MALKLTKRIFVTFFTLFLVFSPYPVLMAQADEYLPVVVDPKFHELSEPQYQVVRTTKHYITAYTSDAAQTDDSPCITANGYNVCEGNNEDTIAANFLPFGTKVRIPELFGDRVFVVRDRMNRRFPNKVDVWMRDYDQAIEFGLQTAKIEVLQEIN